MKKNEIPPTRAREGLGLPSPRDFPRAGEAHRDRPEGKANLDPHELVLEVLHSFSVCLFQRGCLISASSHIILQRQA